MSTSDKLVRSALVHTAVAAFCALFGAVYEEYSHGVISYFMIYAFAFPLVLGVLVPLALCAAKKRVPSQKAAWCWNAGIATLTVGSIFYGVIEIYGTTNRLASVYPAVGGILLLAGAGLYHFEKDGDEN